MENVMLCESIKETEVGNYNSPKYSANIKFDGERIIAEINEFGNVFLTNRRNRLKNKQYPEVVEALSRFKSCILDGEIITYDDKFNRLQRRAGTKDIDKIEQLRKEIPVKFMVFDILKIENQILTGKPLVQRIAYRWDTIDIEELVNLKAVEFVVYGETSLMYKRAKEEEREGIVIKDMNSKYEYRRSKSWIKCKFFKEAEILVEKYTINNAGIRCEDKLGNAVQVAGEQSKAVKECIDLTGCCSIIIQYLEKTKDNRYRFISFKRKTKDLNEDDIDLILHNESTCFVKCISCGCEARKEEMSEADVKGSKEYICDECKDTDDYFVEERNERMGDKNGN